MFSVLPKVSLQSVRGVWFLDVAWSAAFGVTLSDAGTIILFLLQICSVFKFPLFFWNSSGILDGTSPRPAYLAILGRSLLRAVGQARAKHLGTELCLARKAQRLGSWAAHCRLDHPMPGVQRIMWLGERINMDELP